MGQSCSGTGTCGGASGATIYLDNSAVFASFTTYYERIEDAYTFGAGGETHKPSIGLNCNGVESAVTSPCSVVLSAGHHTLHVLLRDQFGSGLSATPSAFSEVVTTRVTGVAGTPEPGTFVLLATGILSLLLAKRLIGGAQSSSKKLQ